MWVQTRDYMIPYIQFYFITAGEVSYFTINYQLRVFYHILKAYIKASLNIQNLYKSLEYIY